MHQLCTVSIASALLAVHLALALQGQDAARHQATQKQSLSSRRVVGQVVDSLGRKIPKGEVWTTQIDSHKRLQATRLRRSGSFMLKGVASDNTLELHASADGFGMATTSLRSSKHDLSVRIQLWPAARLRGRIFDEDGDAIEDAQICVESAFQNPLPGTKNVQVVTSDAEGRFVLEKLLLGSHMLSACATGYRFYRQNLTISKDMDWTMTLRRGKEPAMSISVRGITGKPIEGCTINARTFERRRAVAVPPRLVSGRSDAAGRWSVPTPKQFEYRITVSKPGFQQSAERKISLGTSRERDFVLRPLEHLPLRGRVLDEHKRPVAQLRLLCLNGQRRKIAELRSDMDGRFEFEAQLRFQDAFLLELRDHEYALIASPTSKRDLPEKRSYVGKFDPERSHELYVTRGLEIRGRVLGSDANPARYQRVELTYANSQDGASKWRQWLHTRSDARGRFAFHSVAPFVRAVRVETRGRAGIANSPAFSLESTERVKKLEIICKPAARIRGFVSWKGQPVVAARVYCLPAGRGKRRGTSAGAQGRWTCTDRSGHFAFLDLEGGNYEFKTLIAPRWQLCIKGRLRPETYEVTSGQRLELQLRY